MSSVSVRENLQKIRNDLSKAVPHEVRILAVTKNQPVDRLQAAYEAGIRHFGVNYVQQFDELRTQLPSDISWHFIGHIQSRKAKLLTGFSCVESLDRMEVAQILSERCVDAGVRCDVLVEVNIGAEPQKSGVLTSGLDDFLKQVKALPGLALKGLMAMPPPLQPVTAREPHFRQMRQLFERHRKAYSFDTLSMGTSEDFVVAAKAGATEIRLGESLLGSRSMTR